MYIGRHIEEKPLDMSKFDNKNVVKVAERHLATIQDAKRRKVLENFIEHANAELEARVDDLLASCSSRFQDYRNWGGSQDNALSRGPQSYEEMTEYYKTLVSMNAFVLHVEVEKLIVEEDTLVYDGVLHQLYPGQLIQSMFGFDVDDENAVYQMTKRMCTFFIFDEEGKGAGEQSYIHGPITPENVTKVPSDQVPAIFLERASTVVAG